VRRILLVLTAAAMMVAMMAVTAGAASATVHRLSCSDERASDSANGPPGGASNPPGITGGDFNGDNAPSSNPALIVDEDENAQGGLTPESKKDAVGQDAEHSNADKPGCVPPGQEDE
jgi:hypothetical protein